MISTVLLKFKPKPMHVPALSVSQPLEAMILRNTIAITIIGTTDNIDNNIKNKNITEAMVNTEPMLI